MNSINDSDITGEQISSNLLNKSHSKQMYSFPKASRFKLSKTPSSSVFYNIPSSRSSRSTSMGYGTKSDFTKNKNNPNLPFYNIKRLFDYRETPLYSFGQILIYKKKDKGPGPAKYNIRKNFGSDAPKFSFGKKIKNKKKENFPGPGSYENYIKINCKNPLSKYKNSLINGWSLSKSYRMNKIDNFIPGPNYYHLGNLINGSGFIFNSKYKSSLGKSMISRRGSFLQGNDNPGPGSYESFSEFGIYRKKFFKGKLVKGNVSCIDFFKGKTMKKFIFDQENNSRVDSYNGKEWVLIYLNFFFFFFFCF